MLDKQWGYRPQGHGAHDEQHRQKIPDKIYKVGHRLRRNLRVHELDGGENNSISVHAWYHG